MKLSKLALPVLLGILSGAFPLASLSQAAKPAVDKALAKPPAMEKLDDVSDSGVTIGKPKDNNMTTREIQADGRVREVEVNTGRTKYTVKADPQIGNAQRGTLQGSSTSAARFNVIQFGGKRAQKEGAVTNSAPATRPSAEQSATVTPADAPVKTSGSPKSASSPALSK